VSWPFDLYIVVLVPSLTVNVSVATMPSVNSEVPAVSGTVPVAIAGAPVVPVELDGLDELELDDGDEDDDDDEDGEAFDDDEAGLLEPVVPLEFP
jgi:hypothetical protein